MSNDIVRAEELKMRYLTEAILTASPATRLTMLFDHMVLDMHKADAAFESADLKVVNDSLCHVQEILVNLRATMRTDLWGGAGTLISLYSFLHQELVLANLHKDRDQARRAAVLLDELAAAWHGAAENIASETSPVAVAGGVA